MTVHLLPVFPQYAGAIRAFLGSISGHSFKQSFHPKGQISRCDLPRCRKKILVSAGEDLTQDAIALNVNSLVFNMLRASFFQLGYCLS